VHPFTLERPRELVTAIALAAAPGGPSAEYIAGGTDMLPLLKEEIRHPDRLVALGAGALDDRIEIRADGFLRIGAAATMSAVAEHEGVRTGFPLIAQALLAGASPQVRNMATMGGNLLQRTRCAYFRDPGVAQCNKRRPGTGCAAAQGEHRMHAVLGASEECLAVHPSDLAVALVALEAVLQLSGAEGDRLVPIEVFHRLPGNTPHIETVMGPGEVITAIEVPAAPWLATACHYLKVRDRASFEFALVSAAVALEIDDDRIASARVAMGGVGTRPWRMRGVEDALTGARRDAEIYMTAAERAVEGAAPRLGNAFKVPLMKATLARALRIAGGHR
jgi:xanthine dehydrogenase YagS FAD-binding subunit